MKRAHRRMLIGGMGVLVASGLTAIAVGLSASAQDPPSATSRPAATEAVSRGDLVERVSVKGTLAYADPREVGTSRTGTVTGVPDVGSVIGRGGELFRIDDRPVILLRGELPAWRSFEAGMTTGRDVTQLEQNLRSLGFFGPEPDEKFDAATAAAIGAWEKSLGLPATGRLDQGQLVFGSGDVRVASVKSPVGSPAGPTVLGVTSTTKQVVAVAAPALRSVVPKGAEVAVSLPDGTETPGTVTSVGALVEQMSPNGETSMVLPITVTLGDPAVAKKYSDVTVKLTATRVLSKDALLLPVSALLAKPGGGFEVEVASEQGTKRVPVELGGFADGLVEVTGGALTSGDHVVVAT